MGRFRGFCLGAGLACGLFGIGDPAHSDVPYDLNGDGRIDAAFAERESPTDLPRDHDDDGRLDSPQASVPVAPQPDWGFDLVWDSANILNTIWTVAAGDADHDGLFDLAGATWNPNVIHLFEADGLGGYSEIWDSSMQTPPGAYRSIVFADTDGDGLGEILGGEVSTLGKVMLFEESEDGFAFVHDTIRESDFTGALRLRTVLTGDTDRDGRQEVIVASGGSSPTCGLVAIWEHDGIVGENTYTRVFEYTTVSYLFQATLGDSDNDGYPEIILGLGGFGGHPMNIRRIEYDPAGGTWQHYMYTSAVIGLPIAPLVADFDEDGDNELAFGTDEFVVLFENTGVNSYAPRFTTAEPLGGSVLCLAQYPIGSGAQATFAAGSFEGNAALWGYDLAGDTFGQVASLPALGGAVRGMALDDDGADLREELILAIASPIDQVQVFRRGVDPAGLDDESRPVDQVRLVGAHPVTGDAFFQVTDGTRGLIIRDAQGRTVRELPAMAGGVRWDGRDRFGRRAANGVYWVRAVDPVRRQVSRRIMLLR